MELLVLQQFAFDKRDIAVWYMMVVVEVAVAVPTLVPNSDDERHDHKLLFVPRDVLTTVCYNVDKTLALLLMAQIEYSDHFSRRTLIPVACGVVVDIDPDIPQS